MAYIWAMAVISIVFTPIIVWPLNSAMVALEENIGYVFTGADLFAMQVIHVCTGYILVFVLLFIIFKTLIASKAENAGAMQ